MSSIYYNGNEKDRTDSEITGENARADTGAGQFQRVCVLTTLGWRGYCRFMGISRIISVPCRRTVREATDRSLA